MSSFSSFPLSPPAHSFFIGPTVINIYIYTRCTNIHEARGLFVIPGWHFDVRECVLFIGNPSLSLVSLVQVLVGGSGARKNEFAGACAPNKPLRVLHAAQSLEPRFGDLKDPSSRPPGAFLTPKRPPNLSKTQRFAPKCQIGIHLLTRTSLGCTYEQPTLYSQQFIPQRRRRIMPRAKRNKSIKVCVIDGRRGRLS